MSLFDSEAGRHARTGGGWKLHRQHRYAASGPPQDEIGLVALSSFLLARSDDVVVAFRGITAYSDGLMLNLVVFFADEQRVEDLGWALQEYSRSPGRFRLGLVFADGRIARSGSGDAPELEPDGGGDAQLLLLNSTVGPLVWEGNYWLTPLPAEGPMVLGCMWPDRGIAETLVQLDPAPLLVAARASGPVWELPLS